MNKLPFRLNFSWMLLGNVTYAGGQWLTLIVLTKMGSTAMVGQFALGLAVTAPVFMLSNLQLGTVLATDAKKENTFGVYLSLRLLTTAAALIGIPGLAILSGYRGQTLGIIILIGMAKALEAVSDIFYGLFQQSERLDRTAASMIIKSALSVILVAAALYLSQSLYWACGAMVVAWTTVLLAYDLPNGLRLATDENAPTTDVRLSSRPGRKNTAPVWDPQLLFNLFRLALPLGLVMMVISLKTNVPRYVIENHWGEAELGIFAAIAYLMVAGRTIVGAMGNSASPGLAQYYAFSRKHEFSSLLLRLLGGSAVLGAAGVLAALFFGREILIFLYRPEYGHQEALLIWVLVAAGLQNLCLVLGVGMTAARKFRIQVVIDTFSLGVVAMLSAWLIPPHGLLGAAWTVCLIYAMEIPVKGAILWRALQSKEAR